LGLVGIVECVISGELLEYRPDAGLVLACPLRDLFKRDFQEAKINDVPVLYELEAVHEVVLEGLRP
jgi:hypothetical protein